MSRTDLNENRRFLPARAVWEKYGVTSMTLHRWLRDPEMGFPKPIYLGRLRYFDAAEIDAFDARRMAEREAAA